MSRKDYQALAQLIGEAQAEGQDLTRFTSGLISLLIGDNPRFDRTRFLNAIEEASK
jgi:hypothetical protein